MKYEFTGETKVIGNITFKRIRRLSDGLVGGWIEKEFNLSQEGDCFIYDNAHVYNDARVYGNACVDGNAHVYNDACVYGNAWVYGNARVYGNACVDGNAQVFGDACVDGNAVISQRMHIQFVNNLLEVDPKDIRHECKTVAPIQTIIKPANAVSSEFAVVVVFTDGVAHSYTIDGRPTPTAAQRFIFKPKKVKRLKPLHVVLAETNYHQFDSRGCIHSMEWAYTISPLMVQYFGTTHISPNWHWDEKWIEEVDEEVK